MLPPESKAKTSPAKKQAQPPVSDKLAGSNKRTGSADLSESSNEKARKKPKKNQPLPGITVPKPSATASGSGQDQKLVKLKVPPEKFSQIISLTPTSVQSKKRKAVAEGGSGSGDDTAGEMSDTNGAKKQRVKLVAGGRSLSPNAANSRQASPAPAAAKSRAGSPNAPADPSRPGSPAVPAGMKNVYWSANFS